MIDQLEYFGIIAVAALFGALIGWEREKAQRPAGLRTHILVSSGAAFLTLLGYVTMEKYLAFFPTAAISNDPLRVLNAIVIGISFIGAGVILKDEKEGKVRNLTTAASVLFASAVGMATALGQYYLAGFCSIFILFVNRVVYMVEEKKAAASGSDSESGGKQ